MLSAGFAERGAAGPAVPAPGPLGLSPAQTWRVFWTDVSAVSRLGGLKNHSETVFPTLLHFQGGFSTFLVPEVTLRVLLTERPRCAVSVRRRLQTKQALSRGALVGMRLENRPL